jgi:hypothetical protein
MLTTQLPLLIGINFMGHARQSFGIVHLRSNNHRVLLLVGTAAQYYNIKSVSEVYGQWLPEI